MRKLWGLTLSLVVAMAFAMPAAAQQPAAAPAATPAAPATPPKPKKPKTPKPAAAAPGATPDATPAATPAKPPATVGGAKTKLLGQYGDWGAYSASPGGKKICFIIAKPGSAETNPPDRPRNPVYMFISTRPADKVSNEVSIIIGYPFKPGSEANAQIGSTAYALYTQVDGAWIKNAAEETQMVDAMRTGDTAVITGVSAKGTQTTDTYTLKGVSQALDRVAQECK
jgi:Invasion associated locus B (IalB) protein